MNGNTLTDKKILFAKECLFAAIIDWYDILYAKRHDGYKEFMLDLFGLDLFGPTNEYPAYEGSNAARDMFEMFCCNDLRKFETIFFKDFRDTTYKSGDLEIGLVAMDD